LPIRCLSACPFFLAGGLKIIYDVWLFHGFRTLKPPEEKTREHHQ
jgi:hypothetical protein